MTATDLTPSAGVVTIDLGDGSTLHRLDSASNITSWSHSVTTDGIQGTLAVTKNAGYTISWSGLVDTWLGGVAPTMVDGNTIYFPIVRDGSEWIASPPRDLGGFQYTVHAGVSGAHVLSVTNGTVQDYLLTGDTTISASDIPERCPISVWFIQDSGGGHVLTFTNMVRFGEPFTVETAGSGIQNIIFTKRNGVVYYQNAGSQAESGNQTQVSAVALTGTTAE